MRSASNSDKAPNAQIAHSDLSESALQAGAELFNRALELGHAAVYRRNYDSVRYEYMGDHIREITGYGPEEITPEIWDQLLISAELKGSLAGLTLEEAIHRARVGEIDRWQVDAQIQTRSGELRWVSDMSICLFNSDGHCYGCLGILQDITERKNAEQSLAQAASILHQKNTQLEEDLALASEFQTALLPRQFPAFPRHAPVGQERLRVHHRYQPVGAVSGDFFDVIAISDTQAGVIVCDVMGHGVRAALVTGMVRALIQQSLGWASDPGSFLGELNRGLCFIMERARQLVFVSAAYLVFDTETRMVKYASAGHPRQIYIQAAYQKVEFFTVSDDDGARPADPVLGFRREAVYNSSTFEFTPGDRVLLFTDGVLEAENAGGELYDSGRLLNCLIQQIAAPVPVLLDALLADVREFASPEGITDDVCLVGIETLEPADSKE